MRPITDLQRKVNQFGVISDYIPSGDQPKAIAELVERITAGEQDVVLLGATGTGKSATTAWLIEKLQRPTLVLAPNKTLAAQLANEFRELMPNNAVEYFVSYYDYYQPEAYVPQTDTFIEKDSSVNSEVERLRHSATNSLLTRRDVIVVATVSCIYGLGTPQEYVDRMIKLQVGEAIERNQLLRRFVDIQYKRNDMAFERGTFRVRGDTIEIIPMYEELALRIEMFGDEIERITTLHPLTGEIIRDETEMYIFPASHYSAGPETMNRAISEIEAELEVKVDEFERQNKLLEAQRIRMRTTFDIEMMRQLGFCSGIENYSRHIDGRDPGSPPNCLLDYFPEDFLVVIDESHVTVPQIGAMYEGDASRKRTLVEHGFRLPSAMDNRPLRFAEFVERKGQTVYLSATPGKYELEKTGGQFVEQVIRPTGLIDPQIVVKPIKSQIDDLVYEINLRAAKNERILVTTLTKKMSEDLTDYLMGLGIRVRYLHSEVDTLRRVELLRELRSGEYDVLIGINLLREGLDLPEVSLVAILDADKQGFLRSATSLIQTIGRAARNVSGEVHMYADSITPAMAQAIDETNRRREKQVAYNTANGIDPTPLRKKISDITDSIVKEAEDTAGLGKQVPSSGISGPRHSLPRQELIGLIESLTDQMKLAASDLQFELAARFRDEIRELKKELRGMEEAGT
ncbi:MAG: excinuclease ABC subunit UvrB [Actinobacteria bacterium]|uniref:UvrABC system protein B n=1 Tax=freshwater metagenome TaxID=449393 RepID=A0A6J6QC14_9ZZZZ|nr:excinuclease ABC subunit UvrB [Actinomycetota bacterium]MSW22278.1 excinuclease ABC subunit UvrB [Actinomycetota bacterium]MSX04103.1 excinuclease ABC subunit UvrB [Actinomycetota bacterium]MSX61753.1 excinuclease ABC subunit UvrB [Actinomycetota bacterium]MSX84248.1 excinuclease ABC subunit UvrB [Actinomycetota bacterium]